MDTNVALKPYLDFDTPDSSAQLGLSLNINFQMKIALIGYGKMGKVIESIALSRGHEIALKIDKDSGDYDLNTVDVAINFSTPESAVENIRKALENNVPVI